MQASLGEVEWSEEKKRDLSLAGRGPTGGI